MKCKGKKSVFLLDRRLSKEAISFSRRERGFMPVQVGVKTSVQDSVYQVLKDGIMTMKLVPGTAMSTKEMAERLNVSRTPVREAFIRLHEEGLVEIIPQRETLVSRLDMDRIREERFIRESLELAVLTPFMKHYRPGDEKVFLDCVAEQELCQKEKRYADFLDSDNRMHHAFFTIAHRTLAWNTLQTVHGHDYRFRFLVIQNEEIMAETIEQHKKIISYIKQGQKDLLYQELAAHLRKVDYEWEDLAVKYPDYFKSEEQQGGLRIGSL